MKVNFLNSSSLTPREVALWGEVWGGRVEGGGRGGRGRGGGRKGGCYIVLTRLPVSFPDFEKKAAL